MKTRFESIMQYIGMSAGAVITGALMCVFCFGVLPLIPDYAWLRWISFAYFMVGVVWLMAESVIGWISDTLSRKQPA